MCYVSFAGMTLMELAIGEKMFLDPSSNTVLDANDLLLLLEQHKLWVRTVKCAITGCAAVHTAYI